MKQSTKKRLVSFIITVLGILVATSIYGLSLREPKNGDNRKGKLHFLVELTTVDAAENFLTSANKQIPSAMSFEAPPFHQYYDNASNLAWGNDYRSILDERLHLDQNRILLIAEEHQDTTRTKIHLKQLDLVEAASLIQESDIANFILTNEPPQYVPGRIVLKIKPDSSLSEIVENLPTDSLLQFCNFDSAEPLLKERKPAEGRNLRQEAKIKERNRQVKKLGLNRYFMVDCSPSLSMKRILQLAMSLPQVELAEIDGIGRLR